LFVVERISAASRSLRSVDLVDHFVQEPVKRFDYSTWSRPLRSMRWGAPPSPSKEQSTRQAKWADPQSENHGRQRSGTVAIDYPPDAYRPHRRGEIADTSSPLAATSSSGANRCKGSGGLSPPLAAMTAHQKD
jgi:hypothetical protein